MASESFQRVFRLRYAAFNQNLTINNYGFGSLPQNYTLMTLWFLENRASEKGNDCVLPPSCWRKAKSGRAARNFQNIEAYGRWVWPSALKFTSEGIHGAWK
jgi:hypothetical protein